MISKVVAKIFRCFSNEPFIFYLQIVHGANATTLIQQQQQHSADALEGLQALAEQAGLVDSVVEEQVKAKIGLDMF